MIASLVMFDVAAASILSVGLPACLCLLSIEYHKSMAIRLNFDQANCTEIHPAIVGHVFLVPKHGEHPKHAQMKQNRCFDATFRQLPQPLKYQETGLSSTPKADSVQSKCIQQCTLPYGIE